MNENTILIEDNQEITEVEEIEEEVITCSCCGAVIDEDVDDYEIIGDEIICRECLDSHYCQCDRCGRYIPLDDDYGDDDTVLCQDCYENYYSRCECCDRIVPNDEIYDLDGNYYCESCYEEKKYRSIHQYSYKPSPIFHGDKCCRHFGIELEIDLGGLDNDNAESILDIANDREENLYCKSDGSIDDGFEMVSHPCTLDYHMKEFPWEDIMHEAVRMGYRSHQTSTCGLHVHVSRNSLGESTEEQEVTISKILYFVEKHWNELVIFSRRTEYNLNRWAARHGFEKKPREILDKAKGSRNRYTAINLINFATIEFRIFRGTLKYNTFIATLQLVNHICELACNCTDFELEAMSWSEFVRNIKEPELIQYLKERRLYVNEAVESEEM